MTRQSNQSTTPLFRLDSWILRVRSDASSGPKTPTCETIANAVFLYLPSRHRRKIAAHNHHHFLPL
jgi:hypothetical protein